MLYLLLCVEEGGLMKKLALFLTVIFLLNPFSANASTSQDGADYIVGIGEKALKDGDVSEAIHEFSKALMLDPDNKKARWYLVKLHVDEDGIYAGARTPEEQMGDMAQDIQEYEDDLSGLERDRYYLQERVDLLEDAIERKGDHALLKDIEDYYREMAFYDIDPNLPYDQQLAALYRKHHEFKEYTYDRDRVQDKTIVVMNQLLGYKEEHLEDAKDDFVRHRIALARNNRDLLGKVTHLRELQDQYDMYVSKNLRDTEKVKQLERELSQARSEVDLLKRAHKSELNNLKEQVDSLEEKL